jgi:hypothetical protein
VNPHVNIAVAAAPEPRQSLSFETKRGPAWTPAGNLDPLVAPGRGHIHSITQAPLEKRRPRDRRSVLAVALEALIVLHLEHHHQVALGPFRGPAAPWPRSVM